jgi:ribose transport system substrate-binding protein
MSVMENLLTTHPDLKAVFATNDQMALGAVEAIAARNMKGKVLVVGVDATAEAVRAIQDGRLAADIAMHPEALGGKSVEAAIQATKGQQIQARITTGESLVTPENAAQFLK